MLERNYDPDLWSASEQGSIEMQLGIASSERNCLNKFRMLRRGSRPRLTDSVKLSPSSVAAASGDRYRSTSEWNTSTATSTSTTTSVSVKSSCTSDRSSPADHLSAATTTSSITMSRRADGSSPVEFEAVVSATTSRDMESLLTLPTPIDRSAKKRLQYEKIRRMHQQISSAKREETGDGGLEPAGTRGQNATEIITSLAEHELETPITPKSRNNGIESPRPAVLRSNSSSERTPSPGQQSMEVSLVRDPNPIVMGDNVDQYYPHQPAPPPPPPPVPRATTVVHPSQQRPLTSQRLPPLPPQQTQKQQGQQRPAVARPEQTQDASDNQRQSPPPPPPLPPRKQQVQGHRRSSPNQTSVNSVDTDRATIGTTGSNESYENLVLVFDGILQSQIQKHGEVHELVANAYRNLGMVHAKHAADVVSKENAGEAAAHSFPLQRQSRAKALACYQASARISRDVYGPLHPSVAVSLVRIGLLLLESGQYENAVVTFKEALRVRLAVYGTTHRLVANVWNNLGLCSVYLMNFAEGKQYFEAALEIQRKVIEEEGKQTDQDRLELADTLFNLGGLYIEWIRQKGSNTLLAVEAENIFVEALKLRIEVLGPDDEMVLRIKTLLDSARTPSMPKTRTGDFSRTTATSTLSNSLTTWCRSRASSPDMQESERRNLVPTPATTNMSKRVASTRTASTRMTTPSYYYHEDEATVDTADSTSLRRNTSNNRNRVVTPQPPCKPLQACAELDDEPLFSQTSQVHGHNTLPSMQGDRSFLGAFTNVLTAGTPTSQLPSRTRTRSASPYADRSMTPMSMESHESPPMPRSDSSREPPPPVPINVRPPSLQGNGLLSVVKPQHVPSSLSMQSSLSARTRSRTSTTSSKKIGTKLAALQQRANPNVLVDRVTSQQSDMSSFRSTAISRSASPSKETVQSLTIPSHGTNKPLMTVKEQDAVVDKGESYARLVQLIANAKYKKQMLMQQAAAKQRRELRAASEEAYYNAICNL